jgi:hypothetical protein
MMRTALLPPHLRAMERAQRPAADRAGNPGVARRDYVSSRRIG